MENDQSKTTLFKLAYDQLTSLKFTNGTQISIGGYINKFNDLVEKVRQYDTLSDAQARTIFIDSVTNSDQKSLIFDAEKDDWDLQHLQKMMRKMDVKFNLKIGSFISFN